MKKTLSFVLLAMVLAPACLKAQERQKPKHKKHEIYGSWGYNKEWYTHSNLHVDQPSLGNNYTFVSAKAHDHPGWDAQFFTKALSIPQYNYRLGYFFNEKKGLAFEINFDHTKYILAEQDVRIKGAMNGQVVDKVIHWPDDSSAHYYLNNGANFLLFNLVKRWHLFSTRDGKFQVDGLTKTGIGPVIPHVQNKFFGQPENKQHFQVGGMNVGLEGTIRATFFNYVFLEYCNKLDYANYWGLRSYQGTVKQAFGTYEMILNLGVTYPFGKE
ncbi:MAG: hypothetical protein JST47_03785 [Bacteroidetes bacterium]|nr:hypothetical protein [Bacteroidota bacterium]MBS1974156.1 hypothetical protein [Bacteroidota bacterium]